MSETTPVEILLVEDNPQDLELAQRAARSVHRGRAATGLYWLLLNQPPKLEE